jgi:GT2 family glycosyltransferase
MSTRTPDSTLTTSRVTVGIVTKNRPDSLRECLESLAVLGDILVEVLVIDDTSDVAIDSALVDLPEAVAARLRVIRHQHNEGCIVARNTMVREASTEYVLLMDDDAALLSRASIVDALALMEAYPRVGAVACAMAERNGSPWHPATQPAPVDYTCCVPSFIGFAHIIRRSLFLELGGYRESFYFYGEEKDYCLRVLDAGFDIVYMPSARVVHAPNPSTRSRSRYVRYVIRNDCLFALYNEPLPLALLTLPIRLGRYRSMTRDFKDTGGFTWIVREIARLLPSIVGSRRPVSWATVRQWRRVGRTWPAFPQRSET